MELSLTDLLLSVRMDRYGLTDLRLTEGAELSIRCGSRSCAHLILSGSCTLSVDGGETASLKAGDYALLTHGTLHRLQCGTATQRLAANIRLLGLEDSVPIQRFGEGIPGARMLTVVFGSERIRVRPDDSIVPPLVILNGASAIVNLADANRMERLNRDLLGHGGSALGASAMHMLFVQALTEAVGRSYPSGVDSRQFSPVSAAIRIAAHRLDEPWPVERLARSVGMSRSVFSALFTATTGESPGHYLGRVKLTEAERLLRLTDLPISKVAGQCGYRSQAAFTRAFKRRYQQPPERFRSEARLQGAKQGLSTPMA